MANKKKTIKRKVIERKEVEEIEITQVRTVYVFTENFAGASNLKVGDLVSHSRLSKVVEITHKENDSAMVKLEKIKGSWEKKHV